MDSLKGLRQRSASTRAYQFSSCPRCLERGSRLHVLAATHSDCPAAALSQANHSKAATSNGGFPYPLSRVCTSSARHFAEVPSTPLWSRRAALLSLPVFAGGLLPGGWGCGTLAALAESIPRPLRSLGWSVPSELTVLNDLEGQLKVYWLNYDGDAELFGSLSPGSVFTVHTFESHAWRFVDATSGSTVAEHVAAAGQQVVRVAPSTAAAVTAAGVGPGRPNNSYTYTASSRDVGQQQLAATAAQQQQLSGDPMVAAPRTSQPPSTYGPSASPGAFEGFDGLGNEEQQYCLAQLREIKIYPGGGNVLLSLPGASHPMELALAGPEALSLVAATGSLEQRRPSTLGTWTRSLMMSGVELRRVCITRMVDGVYYCRIVLSRPDSSLCSVDATPGDSLSLALQMGRPIYVANEVARVHQSVADVFARRRQAMEAAAARGELDEAIEAEADREAQDALDSITREIPSAPRPVRAFEMDQQLDA